MYIHCMLYVNVNECMFLTEVRKGNVVAVVVQR